MQRQCRESLLPKKLQEALPANILVANFEETQRLLGMLDQSVVGWRSHREAVVVGGCQYADAGKGRIDARFVNGRTDGVLKWPEEVTEKTGCPKQINFSVLRGVRDIDLGAITQLLEWYDNGLRIEGQRVRGMMVEDCGMVLRPASELLDVLASGNRSAAVFYAHGCDALTLRLHLLEVEGLPKEEADDLGSRLRTNLERIGCMVDRPNVAVSHMSGTRFQPRLIGTCG